MRISLIHKLLLQLFLLSFALTVNAKPLQCESDALVQSKKLLNFHVGGDDRIQIDPIVNRLPMIVNPANKKQKFLVLETMGYIYKGNYRMRLIYFPLDNECVLMGQEVLEFASL